MFCGYCGNKLRDGAKFCNKCGTSVAEETEVKSEVNQNENAQSSTSSVITQNHSANNGQSQQASYQTPPKPYYAPGTHPYHRLGGFLMFIVVGSYISGVYSLISVITTIITYSGIFSMGDMLPGGFKGWIIFNMIGSAIISIITGIICISYANQIRNKDSNVLHFIQSSSITMMIFSIVFYSISLIWVKQFDLYGVMKPGSIIGILIAMVMAWIVGLVISSIYAGTSVRLRTYMGSDDYLKQSMFNKNSHPVPVDGSDQVETQQRKTNEAFDPKTQWICPECANINYNYVGTCSCGQVKPSGATNNVWKCPTCGNINPASANKCAKCGRYQFEFKTETWTCPECGTSNSMSVSSCKVCSKRRPQNFDNTVSEKTTSKEPETNEWKCPICGRINANYVGTCGCGQKKP